MRNQAEDFFAQYKGACRKALDSGTENFGTRFGRFDATADEILNFKPSKLFDEYELDQSEDIDSPDDESDESESGEEQIVPPVKISRIFFMGKLLSTPPYSATIMATSSTTPMTIHAPLR